jgi:hypothetical protein
MIILARGTGAGAPPGLQNQRRDLYKNPWWVRFPLPLSKIIRFCPQYFHALHNNRKSQRVGAIKSEGLILKSDLLNFVSVIIYAPNQDTVDESLYGP